MHFLLCLLGQAPIAPDAEGNGFIPLSRGSFMLDFVFTAMFGILLIQAASIYLVRVRKKYHLHKKIQLASAVVLLLAVAAFEVDVRLSVPRWTAFAEQSAYWDYRGINLVAIALAIHLCFAIPTPFVWGYVIYHGLRKFPDPPLPNAHSRRHRRWGWIATFGILLTSLTGWVFYALAFVM
jgi:putative membrane protein